MSIPNMLCSIVEMCRKACRHYLGRHKIRIFINRKFRSRFVLVWHGVQIVNMYIM